MSFDLKNLGGALGGLGGLANLANLGNLTNLGADGLIGIAKEAISKLSKGSYSLDQILGSVPFWKEISGDQKGHIADLFHTIVKDGKLPGVTIGDENKKTYNVD